MSQELARHREHRSGLKSRQTVLSDLQSKREGVSQVVRELLKARDAGKGFSYVRGLVADLVSTDLEHAAVVEAGAGGSAKCVDRHGQLPRFSPMPPSGKSSPGRVTVLAADQLGVSIAGDAGRCPRVRGSCTAMLDFISTTPENSLLAHQLLARTFIADSLALRWRSPARPGAGIASSPLPGK